VQFREAWTHFAEKSLSEEESIEGSGAKKLNDLKIFFQTWPYWYYYLKKVRDQDGKRKHIQMETLSTRHDFGDCTLVPAVQPKLS
uniref:hypothetical protein n=1 Tax=Bacillus thuringiensis TaxID=1428 RepID=UPI00299F5C34